MSTCLHSRIRALITRINHTIHAMRNLLLLNAHRQTAAALAAATAGGRSHITVDQNRQHIVYVASATSVHRLDTDAASCTELQCTDASAADQQIVAVQHLSLNDELCVATAGGEIFVHSLLGGGAAESVGFCPGGIRCMAWSPDQEAVSFVSREGVLIVMDTMYTPVAECVLSEAGFGDGAFVNVGWGAKETQFHGTEGKEARYKKTDEAAGDAGGAEQIDEDDEAKCVQIVWRGDAEYFAVFFDDGQQQQQQRLFKVFDKEGTLHFTSEPAVGLGAAIAWRPQGTWLAVPQQLKNRYVLALFEKNGLKHREIVLPFGADAERVRRLEWSSDSAVLAVETRLVGGGGSRIYLYTMGNYHWYQKQTLEFGGAAAVRHFVWDAQPAQGRKLHVLCADGSLAVWRWVAEVSGSRTGDVADGAMVAVIDGRSVMVTGCRGAVVPPPMYGELVQVERHVNWVEWVAFVGEAERESGEVNRMAVIDVEGVVRVFSCHTDDGFLTAIRAIGTFHPEPASTAAAFPLARTHWLYLTASTLIYATAAHTTSATDSPSLHLCELADGKLRHLGSTVLQSAGQISRICAVSPTEIAVATASGLHRITLDRFNATATSTTLAQPSYTYPDAAEHIACTPCGRHTFALKPKHWLYHNQRSLASGVTSMHLAAEYLLYTTLDELSFVRLSDGAVCGQRRVERGARLVAVVPHDCRTVLQMPRGNLETIQPRVLALCIIGRLLDGLEYGRAFDLMRKQRINLNLLHDHDATRFRANVRAFVLDVGQVQWLNLFLSDLEEADVTCTMYGSNYPGRVVAQKDESASKVTEVCRRVREEIHTLGKQNELLLSILTSYVRERQYEPALQQLWQIRQAEESSSAAAAAPLAVTAADALKHLLYLADVKALYDVALGMYEFDLVRYIAARSQMDPKEYLPQLAALEQIGDVDYRRFRVDLHLKRYERALGHILLCLPERADECVEMVCKQRMFAVALRAFEPIAETEAARPAYVRIQLAYAEHLRENGQFRDACLMYERSGEYAQAILSARHILDWQKCVALARRMGQREEEVGQVAASLVPALVENGQRLEAAQLVLRYQADCPQAVAILCDGRHYVQALFEARMADEQSLIDTVIRPHLESYADTFVGILDADRSQFVEYKERLSIVRRERAAKLAEVAADGDAALLHDDPDADAFSDTSSLRSSRQSASSRGTGKTHKSSKNRRKHERKLLSLKPGNAFEDIALVDALHALALKAFDQQQSAVRQLGKALIDQRADRLGQRVQQALRALLRTVSGALDEIWLPEMAVSGECVPLAEAAGRLDWAAVQREQHYAMIKPHQRYKPTLKAIDWEFDVLE